MATVPGAWSTGTANLLTNGVSVAPRAAAAAIGSATGSVLRLVDFQGTTVEVLAVQSLHGARGVGVGHLDEAEATGTARVSIADERDLLDGSMRCEQGPHRVFSGSKGQISDVKFGHFRVLTELKSNEPGGVEPPPGRGDF